MPHAPHAWTLIGAVQQPSFSKDGSRIFHRRGSGLAQGWVMDADGGHARALTAFDEKVSTLSRSPVDDRLIVGIDAGGDEREQFHLIGLDGAITPVTEAPDVIHNFGAWSPDGSRIA